jgi:predicted ATPase/DNA-binding SARP family transcriptional activator
MRISMLGPLEVRDADGQQVAVGGTRLRSFLIRLAISEGQPVSADQLAEDLWQRQQPADAANAVQALASRLRGSAGRDLIEFGPAGYRVTVGPDQIDVTRFEQLVRTGRDQMARGELDAGSQSIRAALGLWRGPALADVADAAFAAATIARLSELRLSAIEDRIDADFAVGSGAELVPEVEQLSREHPLRERLRAQLMRALYAAGRQADALAVFEDTRRELATSLGIDPSPALAAVHLAILRGELEVPAAAEPGAPDPSPAGPGPGGRRSRLPAQLTTFVGRAEELSHTADLLRESRLVTLTGPGGAGKTRLAVEVASRLTPPDGSWFVALAPVRDALDVPQAVLAALGLHDAVWPPDRLEVARLMGLEPLDRLAELLATRDMVLVLDNCEHLVGALATLATHLLAYAPGVRILATSREPLGITGERLAPVPSLPLPDQGAGLAETAASPAVRLFADRAAAVRPGFTLTAENAAAVVRICQALDGIPLAIELAAARLRTLTPDQVADRLDDRFALLSVGSRGTLPRHQTLRAIVDWSWDLLDDTERMILRRLSVFSGGATPDSAEQVCGARSLDVVEVVASLLDKSLVTADGEREVRYRLLETVRAYAAERLAEAGEADRVAASHARYFVDLAEQAEPKLRGHEQLRWLARLTAEHDNFTEALRYLTGAGDRLAVLRLVGALAWYWITHDYDSEAREWAAAAVALGDGPVPPEVADAYAVCKLLSVMAGFTGDSGPSPADLSAALRELPGIATPTAHPMLALVGPMLAALGGHPAAAQDALETVAGHADPWVRAARFLISGHLAINSGHIDEAAGRLEEGRAQFEQLGDQFAIIICLSGLAEVAMARGQPAVAVAQLEEARALAAGGLAGNWAETARVELGRAMAAAGDIEAGRKEISAAVRTAEIVGEHDDAVHGYAYLSDIARAEGDLAGARDLLDQGLAIVASRKQRPDVAFAAVGCYSRNGCIAEQSGDLEEAARWHRRALDLTRDSPILMVQGSHKAGVVLEGVAALRAAQGEHVAAAELLGLAHTLQGFRNEASLEVHRVIAASPLSAAEFDAAYAAGRERGFEDALAVEP